MNLNLLFQIMTKLKFLPLSGDRIENCVRQFQQLADEVCDVARSLNVVWCILCINSV